MKTKKIIFSIAIVAFGLWGCSDNNSQDAQCLTANCQIQGDIAADIETQLPALDSNLQEPLVFDTNINLITDSITEPTNFTETEPIIQSSSSHDLLIFSSSSEFIIPQIPEIESSSSSEIVQISDTFKEDFRDECNIKNIPTSINNPKLPDPFTMLDGSKVTTASKWKCRREEIGAMYEQIMYGEKPRYPDKVEGSYSNGKFTVKVTDKGKSISFSVTIKNAGSKENPKAALIGFSGGFMGETCGSLGASISGLGIAEIIFNPDNVAPENARGNGNFYTIYGSNASAGTIMAWAWGVSRLIDALEATPEAGIDVHHLGVTGCSRWGKGALAVGAFDARIALVIPQESGSGGASLWRVGAQINKQKGKQFVQGLGSAASEGNWMRTSFKNYDGHETTLPFDQHMLVGMIAPRGLLLLDNAGQEWLGEVPSNYCGQASKEIFDALGASENYTYSQEGSHAHCSLPNGQFDEVKEFVNKFLLEKSANTGKIDYSKNSEQIKFVKSEWIDWTTPSLQ